MQTVNEKTMCLGYKVQVEMLFVMKCTTRDISPPLRDNNTFG